MKYLLFYLLLTAAPAVAQKVKPIETDGAYFTQEDRKARANRKPLGAPIDSTLTGLAVLDARNGFRSYIFGTSPKQYRNLKKWSKNTYAVHGEPLVIGNTPINSILFRTSDEVLSSVEFSTGGERDVRQLLETLKAQYGPPQETGLDKLVWHGQKVTLEFQTNTTNFNAPIASIKHLRAKVFMYSNSLTAKQDALKQAAGKKAAADL